MSKFMKKAVERAKGFEGFHDTVYLSEGKCAIGYGLNLERGSFPPRVLEILGSWLIRHLQEGDLIGIEEPFDNISISPEVADAMLHADMVAHWDELKEKLPRIETWCEPVRLVLLDMAFDMGVVDLLGLKKTIAALREGDWVTASCEMADSKWYSEAESRGVEHVYTVSKLGLSDLNDYQRLTRLEGILARLDTI